MDTQTQIDRLIELAIIQRSELKQLVEQLPQLREHLNAEVEKVFDETEPQLRAELEEWTTKQTADKTAALGVALEAKIAELAKSLEVSTQARYNAIIAERAENARLAAQAEAKIAEHAASLPGAVKEIVSAELARFPRAGEIDQLRKEFAEPRGLNPRGKWQAGETYNKLDLVTINGDSYTSNTDGNRTRPSRSSADWTLVAARGTGGGGGPTSLSELTTVPSDGDLLIGSGTSWVTSNLTAGAGISITVGPGAITISATDGDITLDDGTAASPSLHFTNDPDTGIYRPAANTLGISVSGTQVAYFDENGLTVPSAGVVAGGSIHAGNGNANNPSLSFDGDQDTGFFRHQPNEIGIALGGTQYATLTSTTFSITPVVTMASSLRVNGTTDSSSKDTGAIVTEGGLGVEKSATIGGNLTVSGTGTSSVGGAFNIGANCYVPNANYYRGKNAAGNSDYRLIGVTSGNVVSIDPDAAGATFGGNLTVSGGTTTIIGSAPALALKRSSDNSLVGYIDATTTGTLRLYGGVGGSNTLAASFPQTGNVLIGGTSDGGQKLQVAGTVAKTAAGPTTIAIASNEASNLRDEGRLFIVGNASAGSRYLGLEYYDVGNGAYRNVAAVPNGGNFLIGTTTDLSRLTVVKDAAGSDIGAGEGQVMIAGATNTNKRLAIGFNTTSDYGWLQAGIAGTAYKPLVLNNNGGNVLIGTTIDGGQKLQVSGTVAFTGDLYSPTAGSTWGADSGATGFLVYGAGGGANANKLVLRTNSTTALTLDNSQNATFAGKITAGTWAHGTAEKLQANTTVNNYAGFFVNTASSGNGYALRLHTNGTTSGDYPLYVSSGAGAGSLIFGVTGDGNATFAAWVKAGTAYGTAKSIEVNEAFVNQAQNTTKTVTVALPGGANGATFVLDVGAYGNSGTGYGSLLVKGAGYLGSSTTYDAAEIVKANSGSVTVSSVTKGNNQLTFTVINTAGTVSISVKLTATAGDNLTTIPAITIA